MTRRSVLLMLALVVAVSAIPRAQGSANFSGMWKLDRTDPPIEAGRGGRGGGGGAGAGRGAAASPTFGQAPESLVITQTATGVTVQIGSAKAVYTLDGNLTVTPPGVVTALKTRAHWDGGKLHLHYKEGMNFGRDILSLSGGTLTVVRDLESGGGSTTRTLTYTKAS